MPAKGYVVVQQDAEPGVTRFPGVPDSEGLAALMRAQTQGVRVTNTPMYLKDDNGKTSSFTNKLREAQVFRTPREAQAAIDQIPQMVRPAGLSIQPVDG